MSNSIQEGSNIRIDTSLMGPGKYEIHDKVTFTICLYLQEKEGRWLLMRGPGKDIDTHEVIFRMWSYEEMIDMRKKATSYDIVKRVHMIDNDLLNRLKIQKFMLSWTFGEKNIRLTLHHVNGVLTDETWRSFTNLQPNISSYIIDEMNKVYEYNG